MYHVTLSRNRAFEENGLNESERHNFWSEKVPPCSGLLHLHLTQKNINSCDYLQRRREFLCSLCTTAICRSVSVWVYRCLNDKHHVGPKHKQANKNPIIQSNKQNKTSSNKKNKEKTLTKKSHRPAFCLYWCLYQFGSVLLSTKQHSVSKKKEPHKKIWWWGRNRYLQQIYIVKTCSGSDFACVWHRTSSTTPDISKARTIHSHPFLITGDRKDEIDVLHSCIESCSPCQCGMNIIKRLHVY